MMVMMVLALMLAPATAPASQPDEIRRGMSMSEPPQARYARYYERLARQIEPDLHGEAARVEQYLRFFEREIIHDKRLLVFDVRATSAASKIVLEGVCEYPEQLRSFASLLSALGLEAETERVRIVPTMDRPFALVKARRTFVYSSPASPREVVNEVLGGERIYLLASDGEHFLCHAPDGYVGWVAAADVQQIERTEFNKTEAEVAREAARVAAVIDCAKTKIGLPYVWGGRSEQGMDCSGLVQTAFSSQGIHLPRDAEQQACVGKLVATRWHRDNLRAGDLLFFMGRRGIIAHTAIYLGKSKFIEASDGGVKISSFDAEDAEYAEHRDDTFCFAKRVLE